MQKSEIEPIANEAFDKIMDSTYATKYRPGGKPYVVDEIINEIKMKIKGKIIDYVISQYMDTFWKNKIESKPEIKKELLEIINIENNSIHTNSKTSGKAKVIGNHYLERVALLREQFYKAKSNKNFSLQDSINIENYMKYLDLAKEYARISHSIYDDKFVMAEMYNR